jgi:hypothetical protein
VTESEIYVATMLVLQPEIEALQRLIEKRVKELAVLADQLLKLARQVPIPPPLSMN